MTAPDPNTFPTPRWATYIENRSPKFKGHSSLGLAKTAISTRTVRGGQYIVRDGKRRFEQTVEGGWIYEFVNGKWELVGEIPPDSYVHDHPLWQPKPKRLIIQELPG